MWQYNATLSASLSIVNCKTFNGIKMKNIYFLSDAHLGSRAIEHGRTQERRLVNFLDSIKHKAGAIYLLGDMFDFWYEFKLVVPKGYTRFLGKLSELTDMGVEVHFFIGNHDIWCGDYLSKECGVLFIANLLLLKSMAGNFIWLTVTVWEIRTRNSSFCVRCFIAKRCRLCFQ